LDLSRFRTCVASPFRDYSTEPGTDAPGHVSTTTESSRDKRNYATSPHVLNGPDNSQAEQKTNKQTNNNNNNNKDSHRNSHDALIRPTDGIDCRQQR
jgi:hypothetical protein